MRVLCVLLLSCAAIGGIAAPAQAQLSGYNFCAINDWPVPWDCTSTTTDTTTVQTYLPADVTAPSPFSSLAGQLSLAFASPAGASLQELLAPYLTGSSAALLVDMRTDSTETVEAPQLYGEGLVGVGPAELGLDVTVPMSQTALVTNTHTQTVVEEVYQSQQVLSASAAAFLLGDIYAAVPTTILDGDFDFLAGLLSHAQGGVQAIGQNPHPEPFAFTPATFTPPALDATTFAAASPGTLVAPRRRAWLEGSFERSALTPTADHLGLSFSTAQTAVGIDYADGPWRAGGSLGFGRTGFSQPATGDSGSVTGLRAGAYAGFDAGDWSITGGLAAGYHWTQATRLSGLPAPATSAFGATSLSAALEASRRFSLLGAVLEPLAGAVFSLANTGGFIESGTGQLDLEVQPATTRALNLYVGGRLSGQVALGDDIVLRPEADVRLLYDAIADPRVVTSSFATDPAGPQTALVGLRPGRIAVRLGASLGIEIARTWRLALAYGLELRGGSEPAHSVSGSAGGRF